MRCARVVPRRARPALCRHALRGACYRADCPYGHDLKGVTCLFWLQGRCRDEGACRFRHGFAEDLCEDIAKEARSEETTRAGEGTATGGAEGARGERIHTANLLLHNQRCVERQARTEHAADAKQINIL